MRADVVEQIVPPQRPDRRCLPKDRPAQRMAAQTCAHVELLDKIFRIILHHADFFQHDLLFFFDVLGRELGAMEEIGEQVQGASANAGRELSHKRWWFRAW